MDQGKRKDQYEAAALGAFIGWIGIILISLMALIIDTII